MASPIPDRDNLESMSRTDIQRLCKDNNIKANMRTDEMINALCDLLNGKSVPRPHRATSTSDRAVSQAHPKSRRSLQPPASKPSEPSKKAALQPSESNTDAESQSDTTPPSAAPAPPPSAPQSTSSTPATTRRKAQDIQTHLGKGRPVVAGGSGARNVTKPFSRGARRGKKSAMLREDVIVEEEENAPEASSSKVKTEDVANNASPPLDRPSSTLPIERPSSTLPLPPSRPSSTLPLVRPSSTLLIPPSRASSTLPNLSRPSSTRPLSPALPHSPPHPQTLEHAPAHLSTSRYHQGIGQGRPSSAVTVPAQDSTQLYTHAHTNDLLPAPNQLHSELPAHAHDPDFDPTHLPTPAPSHSQPSYSLPSAQITALEARVAQLEANAAPNEDRDDGGVVAVRLKALEAAVADLPTLRTAVAQITVLQDEVGRLDKRAGELGEKVGALEGRLGELEGENKALRARVMGLEGGGDRMEGVVRSLEREKEKEKGADARTANVRPSKPPPHPTLSKFPTHLSAAPLANPSPSLPTLGKRTRSLSDDTPDVSAAPPAHTPHAEDDGQGTHNPAGHKPNPTARDPARTTRPQRKKARLAIDSEDEDAGAAAAAFAFAYLGPDAGVGVGPSSTSTPRQPSSTSTPQAQQRSDSPSGFFSVGKRAPTPVRADVEGVEAYLNLENGDEEDGSSMLATAPAPARPLPRTGAGTGTEPPTPHTPPARTLPLPALHSGPGTPPRSPARASAALVTNHPDTHSNHAHNSRARTPSDPQLLNDPGFFGGPLPAFYPSAEGTELPYPLTMFGGGGVGEPATPPPPASLGVGLGMGEQYVTPTRMMGLGEAWRYDAAGLATAADADMDTDAGKDGDGDVPATSSTDATTATTATSSSIRPPSSHASTTTLPYTYTFRPSGRRERNDAYQPFFTPHRGPGTGRLRTGLTPARGVAVGTGVGAGVGLKSPVVVTEGAGAKEGTREEGGAAADVDEDGVARSPPQLRTLYGTELDGDTRFGDYGRDLGGFDWGRYGAR